ncbi:6-phosphofructokinase [Muriicola sp. E247]|uniref:6-phosphofructokinase n=1 Tax=Muriicola sp. E247 TaxID=3242730 RepID=UPI0035258B6A
MNTTIKHIGVFTSGGDSPGINAALFAIAKAAEANHIKIRGFLKGYKGLIDGDTINLKTRELQKLMHRGGTILKTARSGRFLPEAGRQLALTNIADITIYNLDCFEKGMDSGNEVTSKNPRNIP